MEPSAPGSAGYSQPTSRISGVGSGLGGITATLIAARLIATQGYVPVFSMLAGLHLSAYLLLRVVERSER